ncbi:MAG TPA: HAMP domain-containing sensor histidine kinase [Candidatus Bathyarchaeia archaeon]|nr:HAMP domain-containing sensor histidine kinase [Candidatus Bathyarchaeia archaeon]
MVVLSSWNGNIMYNEPANIEIIRNTRESIKRSFDLVQSARYEVLRIFSSITAFRRQVRLGVLHLFKESIERGVKVRVLIPADYQQITQIINEVNLVLPDLSIRCVDKSLQNTIGILVIDRKESLIVETKDDTKDSSYEAAGLGAYYDSKPISLSYASIFDSLWKQAELYEKLSETYEQLKIHSKMQKEFLDIAAHELRTPIQPILGLTEILLSGKKIDRAAQEEKLNVIARNAKRLKLLTDDILDVTKIEGQALQLRKELINVNQVISSTVEKIKNQLGHDENAELVFSSLDHNVVFVEADKARISQVISNLLNNAIKFTKRGTVFIRIEEIKQDNNLQKFVAVTVKDTGTGIDSEMLPRLFEKFASKSCKGTGLGLFICKSIVEAHGGRIWAQNNADGKGATFSFSLPIQPT